VDNPTAAPRSAPPTNEPTAGAPDAPDAPDGSETAGSEPGPINPAATEPAGSAPDGSEPGASGAPAATTTTAPPNRPTDEDLPLLAFAQSFELTARDLYQTAIDNGAAGEFADVFTTLMENHEEYGNVIAGIIGADAPQRRDDAIYDQFVAGFNARDFVAGAQAAYDLESTAVATHTDLINQLVGVDGATALAAMLVVEARHCTVLAHIAGRGDDLAALLENSATPLAAPAGS
jgi:hypothetical protein